jgi:hypothetical protein
MRVANAIFDSSNNSGFRTVFRCFSELGRGLGLIPRFMQRSRRPLTVTKFHKSVTNDRLGQ